MLQSDEVRDIIRVLEEDVILRSEFIAALFPDGLDVRIRRRGIMHGERVSVEVTLGELSSSDYLDVDDD